MLYDMSCEGNTELKQSINQSKKTTKEVDPPST